MKKIYLDNNATTLIDPEVRETLLDFLKEGPYNPSSVHTFGRKAKSHLLNCRDSLAQFFKIKPEQLIFTSGGTEALNLLIKGMNLNPYDQVITSNIEHPAIYKTLDELKNKKVDVSELETGVKGYITKEQIEKAITEKTKMIVLSWVNSETGVKNPIEEIATLAKALDILLIVDGVALLGKELFNIPDGVTGMAFSSHKCHGPTGIGLAFIKSPSLLKPEILGGGQEYGLRSGTENLLGIIGMTKAITLLSSHLPKVSTQMKELQIHFESGLKKAGALFHINGEGERVVNTSNLSFKEIDAETLLIQLDRIGIAASHGSACNSGSLALSRVLLNMGVPADQVRSSVRFSFSRFTSKDEIDKAIEGITSIIKNHQEIFC